jgi:uncharacterized SAM-dependent methyltransferase
MTRVNLVTPVDLESRLLACLRRRELPDCFLYVGSAGAQNWLDLDRSDAFPVATTLTNLLSHNVHAVARHMVPVATFLSIGVGNGHKERLLLEGMVERTELRYVAVDVSDHLVDEALTAVEDLPVKTLGITGFCEDLPLLLEHADPPRLVALLGNNFCNYEPDTLLGLMAETLGPDDLLLFDAHLLPERSDDVTAWRASVEHAYQSPVNARFNLGPLLARGVAAEACSFHLELLAFDTAHGHVLRTRKWIEMLRDALVRVGAETVELTAGEVLEMGFTYKYTATQVDGYLRDHGFTTLERFMSEADDNLLTLVRPPSAGRNP